MNNLTYSVVAIGDIILETINEKKIQSVNEEKRINEIWEEEYAKSNGKLSNGKVFCFKNMSQTGRKTTVKGYFEEFKQVLGKRKDPHLEIEISPIGVSGISIFKENQNQYVIFSKRTSQVLEYPEYLELVPSGHLDESTLNNDIVDYKKKILEEFSEEVGLISAKIKHITCIGFVKDLNDEVYDVCCLIEIDSDRNEINESSKSMPEYENPIFVSMNDLSSYVKKNKDKIVPTSLAVIDCYLHSNQQINI